MGLSGVVFPKATSFAGAGIDAHSSNPPLPTPLRFSGKARTGLWPMWAFGSSDSGSAGNGVPKMGKKSLGDMTMKKKLKLLKGLLSEKFSKSISGHSGVGLVSEVKERMVSEAAEVLIKQLQNVKVKAKETKINKKMEKSKMKATEMKESSSSSSSSSSDTDSDNEEVIDVTQLRIKPQEHPPVAGSPTLSNNDTMRRVEVCTGKKCRKAGGEALLGELERAIGVEGAVVGSKCMGKCKDGPNVRVVSCGDRVKVLCINGVGVEDVADIVDTYNQE